MQKVSMPIYTLSWLVWTGRLPWLCTTSTIGIPVTGPGLDGDQANAVIGLVTGPGATASIVAGGSLVAREV